MGPVCVKREYEQDVPHLQQTDQIKIIDINQLRTVSFEFTNRKIVSLNADLLVLFMGLNTNVRGNEHFVGAQVHARRIQEHAKAYLDCNKLKDNFGFEKLEFITFDAKVPNLNFGQVSMIFCDIWREQCHNQATFGKVLRRYFGSLEGQLLKSMVIAQFQPGLGVNLQKGVKRIMRQIVKMTTKPQLIQFACLTDQSKQIYMACINQKRQDLLQSFASSHSLNQTDYF